MGVASNSWRGGTDTDGGLPAAGGGVSADLDQNLLGHWGSGGDVTDASISENKLHPPKSHSGEQKSNGDSGTKLRYSSTCHGSVFPALPILIVTGQAEAYNVSTNDCIAFKTFLLKRNNKIK